MKVVVRHPLTKLYLCADGRWIDDWKSAEHFESTTAATRRCLAAELDAYEVLLKHLTDARYDVVVIESSGSHKPAQERTHVFKPRKSSE